MTMQAMVEQLEGYGFKVKKVYDSLEKAYRFTISKGDHYTSMLFEYPEDPYTRDLKQQSFILEIVHKWDQDHQNQVKASNVEKRKHEVFIATPNYASVQQAVRDLIDKLYAHGIPRINAYDPRRGIVETDHVLIRLLPYSYDRFEGLRCDECFGFTADISRLIKRNGRRGCADISSAPVYIASAERAEAYEYANYIISDVEITHKLYETMKKESNTMEIKKVHFNPPLTVVIWKDGTKTFVKASENDVFDPEKGLALAIAKKALGNKYSYIDEIKKHLPKKEEE